MYQDERTKNIISQLLKQNTGKHFLDSGGAYGRHWESNQKRVFDNEPATRLSFKYGYIEYTKNLYHFLVDNLRYDPDQDHLYQSFSSTQPDNQSYMQDMIIFVEDYLPGLGFEVSGLYGDGDYMLVNTYNHDSNLSQVIQYIHYTTNQGCFVILQIHNGCDVRGGYTKPVVFELVEDMFFCDSDGYISCPGCGSSWYTDDNYHWYINDPGSSPNSHKIQQLDDYKIVDIDDYIQDNNLDYSEVEFLHLLELGKIEYVKRVENQLNLIPDIPKPIIYMIQDEVVLPDDILICDSDGFGRCPGCFGKLSG